MRKILMLMFIGWVSVCSPAMAAQAMPVAVSIVPQKYFVERIAGPLVEVTVMVPPGSSPATYEPKPSQMMALSSARAYFSIGVPFERAWLPRFADSNPQMQIVDTTVRIAKRAMGRHVHHDEGEAHGRHNHDHDHEHGIGDPHVWLSPQLVRMQADQIRDALIRLDPRHAAQYRQGHAAFVADIHALDIKLLKMLSNGARPKPFLVFHPSWGYFAEAYGLKQYSIEIEGKEPSPKELAEIIATAKKSRISVVFAQPEFSQKMANEVAKAIHGQVVRLSPLSYDWEANLLRMAQSFVTKTDSGQEVRND